MPAEDIETVEEPPPPPPEAGSQPDLVVSDVSFSSDPVYLGQPFTANFAVVNQGSGSSGPFTFSLHFHAAAGIADCNMDVPGLAAGQVVQSDCGRTINAGSGGNYPVEATVDIENEVAESDEDNNQTVLTLAVGEIAVDSGGEMGSEPGLPDLVVWSGHFNPAQPVKGETFYAAFEIKNLGTAASGACTFRIKFHASAGVANCDMTVVSLEPGGNQFLTCPTKSNASTGNYPVKATVDAEGEVAESDEGNNVLETTLTLVAP